MWLLKLKFIIISISKVKKKLEIVSKYNINLWHYKLKKIFVQLQYRGYGKTFVENKTFCYKLLIILISGMVNHIFLKLFTNNF